MALSHEREENKVKRRMILVGFWEAIFGSKSIIKDRSSFVLLGYCGCVILRLYKKNGDKKKGKSLK